MRKDTEDAESSALLADICEVSMTVRRGDLVSELVSESRPLLARGVSTLSVMGTVRLTDGNLIYIPSATADPRDPLNMKPWQKIVVVIVVCSFSAISLSLIGGFGGVLVFYIPKYIEDGHSYTRITHLMTYPTLSMGFGNLIAMPIAIAVGRRSMLLAGTVVLIVGSLLCAISNSLEMHMAARMIIGLAAGQSESVVPLIIQEIHFLHERTRVLMIQQTVQVVISATWTLCASPIAQASSPSWWYGLAAAISVVQFLVAIFFLPESKYLRGHEATADARVQRPEACVERPLLDFDRFKARTWKSDMRLWVDEPEWRKASEVLKEVVHMFLCPNIIWVICLAGTSLGINIAIATTYNSVLTKPPYSWAEGFVSYANFAQIPIALFCFPLLGHASDKTIQWRARRNNGMHEPENRLLLLAIPVAMGVVSGLLYGQGAANPELYHWILYPMVLGGFFFAFVGTNIICITYLLDSYPDRAGPVLITICTCRGVLSCLMVFNVAHFINHIGYDGTFAIFSALYAFLAVLGIPVFIYGKEIRTFTSRWTKD